MERDIKLVPSRGLTMQREDEGRDWRRDGGAKGRLCCWRTTFWRWCSRASKIGIFPSSVTFSADSALVRNRPLSGHISDELMLR